MLLQEPGWEALYEKIDRANRLLVGAPTYLESEMVVLGRGGDGRDVNRFLELHSAEIIEFSEDHARIALEAFAKFGRGRHPARLNFGDCMAYAVANLSGLPLLSVGEDFAKTDIVAA